MTYRNTFISTALLAALALFVSGCSESTDQKAESQQSAAPEASAPAQGSMPPGHPMSPTQQAAINAAQGLPKEGTVLEMMHAAGYTYMQVDTGSGEPVWIAATMMRVQPQQKVQWADAAVMQNFASKSLHRTFDKILFVSNASVVQ